MDWDWQHRANFVTLIILIVVIIVAAGGETAVDVIKAIGGLGTFAAVAAVVWGFQYTRASIESQNARTELEHSARVNDHYFRTCGELSSGNEHVRIASLHALKALAESNQPYYAQTIHVINGFIRTRSNEIKPLIPDGADLEEFRSPVDIQSAFDVLSSLARHDPKAWRDIVGNLDGAVLAGMSLPAISFNRWSLRGMHVTNTIFHNCAFKKAELDRSKFIRSAFFFGSFESASLAQVEVIDSHIHGTLFANTNLIDSTWTRILLGYVRSRSPDPFAGAAKMPDNFTEAIKKIYSLWEESETAIVDIV